jgi:cytochrome P450
MSIKSDYTIHKRSDKNDFYKNHEKMWWSDECARWICISPEIIKVILNNPNFFVITHNVEKLAVRFNIDISHLAKVIQQLPVTQNGMRHKELRKRFALVLASRSTVVLAFFEKEFANRLHHLIASKNEFDLSKDLLKPLVQESSLLLSDIAWLKNNKLDKLSTIFDETLSLKNRMELNQSVGEILEELKVNLDEEECYSRIAMFALGNDSILGTISESLVSVFLRNTETVSSNISWGNQIPATGVPVIERMAEIDIDIHGNKIKKGQRVRLYLDSAGYIETSYPSYSSIYFGSGSHTCLGMSIGTKIWTMVTDVFRRVDKKIEITQLIYRKNDNVFTIYDEINVRVYD